MSEPAKEDLMNFTFSQTDNSPMRISRNSHQLHRTSDCSHDLNIDLNKSFDLNKSDEQFKASGAIKTIIEPLNMFQFDSTTQQNNVPRRLSQDLLESDESLGILPDLLKDEMTFDPFITGLASSDDEMNDGINPEINESPPSLMFSPPSDSQFNRISLFLKNISTPLPNFRNYHRYSSTPKYQPSNTANIEPDSYPGFFPDEEEEPIRGSGLVKFETDFDLDGLKSLKPFTSTYKTLSHAQLASILNEETNLKSEVNLRKKPEPVAHLNVTQTLNRTHKIENLFPCEHEGSIQKWDILNNTIQIEQPFFEDSPDAVVSYPIPSTIKITQTGSNNCGKKEKVKTLNSTFAIIKNEIGGNEDCEKTFLIDFNSPKSIYKDKVLNETHVLEMDSVEFSLKEQEGVANLTFTKDLENDAQSYLEHPYHSSHGTTFKPLTHILEETFPENRFKPMKPILEENFTENDSESGESVREKTFSENDFQAMKPNLEKTFSGNDLNEIEAPIENAFQCATSNGQSPETFNFKVNVTFSDEFEIYSITKEAQNDRDVVEFESTNSPKTLPIKIIHEKAGEKSCFHDKINPTENESNSFNKTSLSVSLQSIKDAAFSTEINESADQKIEKFHKRALNEYANRITKVGSSKSPKALANTTFDGKVCTYNQVYHTENESDNSNKMTLSVALEPVEDASFSEEIGEKADQEVEKFYKNDSIKNLNDTFKVISIKSSKTCANTTFNEKVGQKICSHEEIDLTENEYDLPDKISHSDLLHSISNKIFADKNKEKSDVKNNTFYQGDSLQNESSGEIASILYPKINISPTFSNGSVVPFIHECENTSEETEFCYRSISEQDSCFEISPKPAKIYASSTFSGKTDRVQIDMNSVSYENNSVQISENSLKEISVTFPEKTDEQISISIEDDKLQTSPNSHKELINALNPEKADKDIKIQPEIKMVQCDQDSLGVTASTKTTKFGLNDTLFRKATVKLDSSPKSCLVSKTVVKSRLIKPSNFAFSRKTSEQRNGHLPIAKPLCKSIGDKKSIAAKLNHTLNLSYNSTDKSLYKNFTRRLTLSCSSESDTNKSKCVNDFRKPYGIPSKLDIKKPVANSQKSVLNTKFSNGHLKSANIVRDKQNILMEPDLISDRNPMKIKSAAIASLGTKGQISSKLSQCEKLPVKFLKNKECGLKSNIALGYTAEKSTNEVVSCPKVLNRPKKEKSEIGIDNANHEKINSSQSNATSLPRKCLSFNHPKRTCIAKPSITKQKNVPMSNSSKATLLKPSCRLKLPNSVENLGFSSFPKARSHKKISSDGSESQNVLNKKPASENKKSTGFLIKPSMQNPISENHVKQQDITRENVQPTCSILASSREQVVQPLNPLNKKPISKCNFLPVPKIIKDKKVNSNDVQVTRESQLQKQVSQQTSGKLTQLRRIPAPRSKK